jgi:hypothetical protein
MPGGKVSGETPQQGLVEIAEPERTTEFSKGIHRERVGHFKLSRARKNRRESWIIVEHFWKSDIGTQSESELTQEWVLAVDHPGNALWFAERAVRHISTLRATRYFTIEITRSVYPEKHGVLQSGRFTMVHWALRLSWIEVEEMNL